MEKYEILNIVYSTIIENFPSAAEFLEQGRQDLKQDIFFVDLGINSIDYAEIAHIVMDKLNIKHSLDVFTRSNRINEVVEIFHDLCVIRS